MSMHKAFRRSLLASAIAALALTGGQALANSAIIDQTGDWNDADQRHGKRSTGNLAIITQVGTGTSRAGLNIARQRQRGHDNIAEIGQFGSGLHARQAQLGQGNEATITQGSMASPGVDNHAYQVQAGYGNSATINQAGTGNFASQSQIGTGNSATVEQDGGDHSEQFQLGNDNETKNAFGGVNLQRQEGVNNLVGMYMEGNSSFDFYNRQGQWGEDNTLELHVFNSDPGRLSNKQVQVGDRNAAIYFQDGTQGDVEIRQYQKGDENSVVTIASSGSESSGATFESYQDGESNTVVSQWLASTGPVRFTQTQEGDHNRADVVYGGFGGRVESVQLGDNNASLVNLLGVTDAGVFLYQDGVGNGSSFSGFNADDSRFAQQQVGDDNVAELIARDVVNSSTLQRQLGMRNQALIELTTQSDNSHIEQIQIGDDNIAEFVVKNGGRGASRQYQEGDGNYSKLIVDGAQASVLFEQVGDNNSYTASFTANGTYELRQVGNNLGAVQ